jgi:hypothetical protein
MSRAGLLLSLPLLAACGALPVTGDAGLPDGGGAFTDGGLDLNDVSWLLPLPPARSQLLGLAATGPKGELLPRALYDAMPSTVVGLEAATLFDEYRVLGVRVDPCFPRDATGGCIPQLRLVAQPVIADGATATTTRDATLHLFYELTAAELDDAHRTVWALQALAAGRTAGRPLEVHPVLRAEGLAGPYGTMLHALVTRLCGAQNLTRVAFMRLVQEEVAWRFGAFEVEQAALVADPIPRLGTLVEQGVQEFGNTAFRSGELQPTIPGDDLDVLLSESAMRLTDARTLTRGLTSALRLEHPARLSPKTADCGSCHVATRARTNAERQRQVDTSGYPDSFTANPRFDLSRTDAVGDDPRALRAFGYFGAMSALSQRTINESAEVAEALSSHRP